MNTYETVFITPPNLTEEDERATVDLMSKIVTDGGGTFHANDRMGRRRLAYPIQKHEDGVYTRFLYDSANTVPIELQRRMRIADSILRSITVRLEKDWAEAAKKQAVLDAQRRIDEAKEAERRAKEEAEKAEKEAAQAAEADAVPDGEAQAQPEAGTEAADSPEGEAESDPKAESAKPAKDAEEA